MNTIKSNLVDACIVVTITLAMLAGLEIAARLVKQVRDIMYPSNVASPENAILHKQIWGKQHQIDAAGESAMHVTYVEFREKPYASTTLNIDSEGRRWVPGSCEKNDAFTVFTFGGSTMYGAGVPDQYTIPAYFAELLNREGRCIKVVNYGSGWWQSSQSLIQLIEVLKKGIRPQLVIFYDGINEVNAVAYGGTPGGIDPEAEAALKRALDSDNRSVWNSIAQHSLIVRALTRRLFPGHQKTAHNEYSVPEADRLGYASALVNVYATNVRTVDALAREYGFAAYFFLQPCPMIARKNNSVLEEAVFRERAKNRKWEADFFRLSYSIFRRNPYLASNAKYHDISGIFDGMTAELFQDSEHLLPEGNRIVAERIAQEIVRHLPAI
ncbi:MAG: SGNH/GDSL hydrolase family protein [Betaproteobacteria bacterium]|nr:SGNH/GDSL hydrolase family protein [Betaproteobacteria bacterium]